MSINNAHVQMGILLHVGERILLFCDRVELSIKLSVHGGHKSGRLYLTTHRVVFHNKNTSDGLQSLSAPFVALSDLELEQPIFGANCIKGKLRAQPDGQFQGTADFKLFFKNGGAIEFGQALMRTASLASREASSSSRLPRAYEHGSAESGAWYQAPPPAYDFLASQTAAVSTLGWSPGVYSVFQTRPEENSVFMTDDPPPYPGVCLSGSSSDMSCRNRQAGNSSVQATGFYDPSAPPASEGGGLSSAFVHFPEDPPSYDESVGRAGSKKTN